PQRYPPIADETGDWSISPPRDNIYSNALAHIPVHPRCHLRALERPSSRRAGLELTYLNGLPEQAEKPGPKTFLCGPGVFGKSEKIFLGLCGPAAQARCCTKSSMQATMPARR